ncbi:hypothetical protein KQX54_011575, partial [Cotesia glomerata]
KSKYSIVASWKLKLLENSQSKYLCGPNSGSKSIVNLIKNSDKKITLEEWKTKVVDEEHYINETSDDSTDLSFQKRTFHTSTPINLQNCRTPVRFSDVCKLTCSITEKTNSDSSSAPSIPSELLKIWDSCSTNVSTPSHPILSNSRDGEFPKNSDEEFLDANPIVDDTVYEADKT